MTKHTQIIGLDELKAIRLVCLDPQCQAVIELKLASVVNGVAQGRCPGCKKEFQVGYNGQNDPLYGLIRAIKELQFMNERNFGVSLALDEQPDQP